MSPLNSTEAIRIAIENAFPPQSVLVQAIRNAISDVLREPVKIVAELQIKSIAAVGAAIGNAAFIAFERQARPSAVYRPQLSKDGNAWIALYGEDLATGVVGTGNTPEEAMKDFDVAWTRN